MNHDDSHTINSPAEVSLKEALLKIQSGIRYLKSKWLTILIVGIFGGLVGLAYSILNKTNYIAVCTFVLDEGSKGGGLSQYAGLASIVGVDISGLGGSSEGLFTGDNILELYKSRSMIEKALLSEAVFNGRKELLIDRYIDYNKLRSKWKGKEKIDNVTFAGNPENFDRKQDSIISDLVETFNGSIVNITKLDKKLSIIKVEVKSKDELFAKNFADKLVQTASNFYIETKTKRASENVRILQKQTDSIRVILDSSIGKVATAIEAAPNANPALVSLKVPSQKKQIDVQENSALYSELVKNLELSKMSLRHDTPIIQIIDKPVLPLKIDRVRKIKGILLGGILGILIALTVIITKKFYNDLMNS